MTPQAAVALVMRERERYPAGTITLRMTLKPESFALRSFWDDPQNGCVQEAMLARRRPARPVPVAHIIPSQKVVNRMKMVEVLGDPAARERPVLVMQRRGKLVLVDGHHRVYARKLLGQRTVMAHVMTVDRE